MLGVKVQRSAVLGSKFRGQPCLVSEFRGQQYWVQSLEVVSAGLYPYKLW